MNKTHAALIQQLERYATSVTAIRDTLQGVQDFTQWRMMARSKLLTLNQNLASVAHTAVDEDGFDNCRALLALDHMALMDDIELALMVTSWIIRNTISAINSPD